LLELPNVRWNSHFVDVQEKGPFRYWQHRHEFTAKARGAMWGTVVRDVVEFDVGLGVLGQLAGDLFVERALRRTFRHREEVLPPLLLP
jgi:ligand-binding SRPBCC domain-containing protein